MTDFLPNQCPGCGRANGCAVAAGRSASACWCMGAAVRLPLPEDETACYCDDCLHRLAETAATARGTTDGI